MTAVQKNVISNWNTEFIRQTSDQIPFRKQTLLDKANDTPDIWKSLTELEFSQLFFPHFKF